MVKSPSMTKRRRNNWSRLIIIGSLLASLPVISYHLTKKFARSTPAGTVAISELGTAQAEVATKAMETEIFNGCVTKAEWTLYTAQEKVYNNGNTGKLLNYMRERLSETEFALLEKTFGQIGAWVDERDYKTAKEYARTMFYECLANSYSFYDRKPSDLAPVMIERFEMVLQSAHEELLPSDVEDRAEFRT